jgi:hypothetical protein
VILNGEADNVKFNGAIGGIPGSKIILSGFPVKLGYVITGASPSQISNAVGVKDGRGFILRVLANEVILHPVPDVSVAIH